MLALKQRRNDSDYCLALFGKFSNMHFYNRNGRVNDQFRRRSFKMVAVIVKNIVKEPQAN